MLSERLDQQPIDVNVSGVDLEKGIDAGLKILWDRVRRAGELIMRLREERSGLIASIERLEGEVLRLKQEIQKKDELLKGSSQRQGGVEAKQGVVFSNGDRQLLTTRVKELLAKLEAYL